MNIDIQPDKIQQAVEGLKGLSHETRLLILCHLAQKGSMTVNELTEVTQASQSGVSQHLSKMQHAGWVTFERDGASKRYQIANEDHLQLLEALHKIFC